jgi:hypothetical protein
MESRSMVTYEGLGRGIGIEISSFFKSTLKNIFKAGGHAGSPTLGKGSLCSRMIKNNKISE